MMLQCGRFHLSLDRPLIMGVLNVTPDSFSDGGLLTTLGAVRQHVETMLENGVDILDVGGESTRPNATPVSATEELDRILPILELLSTYNTPISLDTRRAEVMGEALSLGCVDMINDICALEDKDALEIVAKTKAAVCLMHMQGTPQTMQKQPRYENVVAEVADYLQRRGQIAMEHGIDKNRIVIDPGFGFGKDFSHNLSLLQHMDQLCALPWPVLVGLSRKFMLGELTGRIPDQRDFATVAIKLLAVQRGASILRVHNVGAVRDMLKVWAAVS